DDAPRIRLASIPARIRNVVDFIFPPHKARSTQIGCGSPSNQTSLVCFTFDSVRTCEFANAGLRPGRNRYRCYSSTERTIETGGKFQRRLRDRDPSRGLRRRQGDYIGM
ncbi:MAG TPA: hypothetical protein VGI78_22985, partial [Acetobacteraceae bacterium]